MLNMALDLFVGIISFITGDELSQCAVIDSLKLNTCFGVHCFISVCIFMMKRWLICYCVFGMYAHPVYYLHFIVDFVCLYIRATLNQDRA